MARFRFTTGIAVMLAASAMAAAQPGGKAPSIIKFKQFGSTPEQFYQSSLTRWTGQLALDLETIKAEITKAKVTPATRAAIGTQVDRAVIRTTELDQLIRRGAAKDKLFAAFAEVDKSLGQLAATIHQNAAARQATAASLARADTAYHQLAAALGTGDNDPTRAKRRLTRLGDAIDDAAEELRNLCADQIPGNERALDRTLSAFARESRLLSRRVRDEADPDLVKQTYGAMADRWSEAGALLGRVQQLPPAVLAQAGRVDGLHRRLGTLLNLSPYPAGVNPPAFFANTKRFAFAVGAAGGAQPRVTVYADDRGTVAYNFFAYDVNFDGGVRVDLADLNGDGIPELVVAPGASKTPATLPVRVYDGRDMNLLMEFVPFAGWKGGLYAVGADLTKTGRALVAINAEGTQHIKVFDLAQGKEIDSFFAHDQKVTGGVRLAFGDLNGDGIPDLFTVNGPGNAPTVVKVFNGKNREVLTEFPVLDNKYRGGGFIAAGDVTGKGLSNPVVGLDAGGPPLVRVFDPKGKMLVEWLAYDERFRGGVRVAVTADHRVVTGPGFGMKNSPVHIFHTGRLKQRPIEIIPFIGFDGGLNVGGR